MQSDEPAGAINESDVMALLNVVYQRSGYDFRDYSPASRRRRIRDRLQAEGLRTVAELRRLVQSDPAALQRLILGLTVSVSAMFRDPAFYRAVREKVVPVLRTYPFVRIWHAGCSTGEEVYSMAILLEEEGMYDRCRIYATDMNDVAINRARSGIYPLSAMKEYTTYYLEAGGIRSFSEYYTAADRDVVFRSSLRRNLIFAQHNLVTDAPFNDFHFVLCRNVLIYFNLALQERVHQLIQNSLVRRGFLALGSKESLRLKPQEQAYEPFDPMQKIYRKVK